VDNVMCFELHGTATFSSASYLLTVTGTYFLGPKTCSAPERKKLQFWFQFLSSGSKRECSVQSVHEREIHSVRPFFVVLQTREPTVREDKHGGGSPCSTL